MRSADVNIFSGFDAPDPGSSLTSDILQAVASDRESHGMKMLQIWAFGFRAILDL